MEVFISFIGCQAMTLRMNEGATLKTDVLGD